MGDTQHRESAERRESRVKGSALALRDLVLEMTGDLRRLDGPMAIERDVTGSAYLRMDSEVHTLIETRAGLAAAAAVARATATKAWGCIGC